MNLLGISLFVIFSKILREPFVKGKSRYRKINFFTTSALLNCIIWVKRYSESSHHKQGIFIRIAIEFFPDALNLEPKQFIKFLCTGI